MDWTIREMKEKGKKAFGNNYWKAVVIALLFSLVSSGVSGSYTSAINRNKYISNTESTNVYSGNDSTDQTQTAIQIEQNNFSKLSEKEKATFSIIIGIFAMILFLVILAIMLLMMILLLNPLQVGCNRFFVKNLDEPARLTHFVYGFEHNYKNVINIFLYKDIYTIAWTCLFIIPGVVKAYEYRMIPYLLCENPDIDKEEAFRISKEMMNGNKMKAFLLDLSFIGWNLLSVLTLGFLAIFYVNPYQFSTNAALYEKLRYGNDNYELPEESNG